MLLLWSLLEHILKERTCISFLKLFSNAKYTLSYKQFQIHNLGIKSIFYSNNNRDYEINVFLLECSMLCN